MGRKFQLKDGSTLFIGCPEDRKRTTGVTAKGDTYSWEIQRSWYLQYNTPPRENGFLNNREVWAQGKSLREAFAALRIEILALTNPDAKEAHDRIRAKKIRIENQTEKAIRLGVDYGMGASRLKGLKYLLDGSIT